MGFNDAKYVLDIILIRITSFNLIGILKYGLNAELFIFHYGPDEQFMGKFKIIDCGF